MTYCFYCFPLLFSPFSLSLTFQLFLSHLYECAHIYFHTIISISSFFIFYFFILPLHASHKYCVNRYSVCHFCPALLSDLHFHSLILSSFRGCNFLFHSLMLGCNILPTCFLHCFSSSAIPQAWQDLIKTEQHRGQRLDVGLLSGERFVKSFFFLHSFSL